MMGIGKYLNWEDLGWESMSDIFKTERVPPLPAWLKRAQEQIGAQPIVAPAPAPAGAQLTEEPSAIASIASMLAPTGAQPAEEPSAIASILGSLAVPTPAPAVAPTPTPTAASMLAPAEEPSAIASIAPVPTPTVSPTPAGGWGDRLAKALSTYAVPLIGLGGAVAGPGTAVKDISGILSGSVQSMQLNEILRKLLSRQLAGGGAGFQGSQIPEISGAEVAGLTPEMVSGLYGTALKVREAERKAPLEAIGAYGTLYSQVMTGNYQAAHVPLLLAQAEKYAAEAQALPATSFFEMAKKVQEILQSQATVDKLRAETTTEKEEPARKRAEVKKLTTEEEKIRSEMSPHQVAIMESAKGLAKAGSTWVDAGDRWVLKDPATGQEYATITKGVEPETLAAAAGPEMKVRAEAATRAAAILMPELEAAYAKAEGKQKAELRSLFESMRGVMDGTVKPETFVAKAAKYPDVIAKFNQASDIYRGGILAGLSEVQIGRMIDALVKTPSPAPGVAPGAAPVPGQPPKKGALLEKYAPKAEEPGKKPSDFFFASALRGQPGGKVYLVRGYDVWWDGKKPIRVEPAGTYKKEQATKGGVKK